MKSLREKLNIPDALVRLRGIVDIEAIQERENTLLNSLLRVPHWDPHRVLLENFPSPRSPVTHRVVNRRIEFGTVENLSRSEHQQLTKLIHSLIPWRTGPYALFEQKIDAEWDSSMKWQRIKPHLDDLKGKRIADVGCNTGYHMFRAAEDDPELVLGIDPSFRCFYQFHLVQRFLQNTRVGYQLLGLEDCELFADVFDVVFCFGVIYHQRDPYAATRTLFEMLKPGGQLVLESMSIPGDEPVAIVPPDRYSKMRNAWYIPTASALESWLIRAGFSEVQTVSHVVTTTEEQHRTELSPEESLEDYLDPENPGRTIEGFPAPWRTVVVARRPD